MRLALEDPSRPGRRPLGVVARSILRMLAVRPAWALTRFPEPPMAALAMLSTGVLLACGPTARPSPPATPKAQYDYVGVSTHVNADTVEGIRATITWTVAPTIRPGYRVGSWIAMSGKGEQGSGSSYRVAEVGWEEEEAGQARILWQWGDSATTGQAQLGPPVSMGSPLRLELDRDDAGDYSFYANQQLLGRGHVSWTPDAFGFFADTHLPSEMLAGSAGHPEVITDLESKFNGTWVPYQGAPYTNSGNFRIKALAPGTYSVWDARQVT